MTYETAFQTYYNALANKAIAQNVTVDCSLLAHAARILANETANGTTRTQEEQAVISQAHCMILG